jgi:hypothetical protein
MASTAALSCWQLTSALPLAVHASAQRFQCGISLCLPGKPPFDTPVPVRLAPAPLPDGGTPLSVTLSDNTVVKLGDAGHRAERVAQRARVAIDSGKMTAGRRSGRTASKNYACISGYKPLRCPICQPGDRFAISDRPSMVDNPSWAVTRMVMASPDGLARTGTCPRRQGCGLGCDSNRITPWTSPGGTVSQVPSCVPDFSWPTQRRGVQPTPVGTRQPS